MEIRLAQKADLARIIEVRTSAFSRMASSAYSDVEVKTLLGDYTEEEFLEMVKDKRLFVAVIDGVIRGTAGWAEENIRHVYVDPDSFNRGIGSQLVAHTEADYQDRTEHAYINAGVILHARGFYERCGYELVTMAKAWDGSDYYQMRKQLPEFT